MRRGRQEPTFEHVTGYASTDGPEAVALFEGYGVRFIPAQRYEMDLYLARNELGECAAVTIGLSRPRQNGKSFAARHYALWCAFVEGRSVLYSAHNGGTTRKMFKLMCDFVEAHEDFRRALRPGGQGIYKAQGNEGIYLASGGMIEFSTRTNSGARGGTYDVIVVDEAQELTDEQRDALMPTTIASDSGDPQMILIGTPPNHKCPGTVFRDLHDRAHAGELGDSWWLEWAAEEVGDPHDVDRWYECNPMMGYRIKERSMRSAADTTPPDSFAREYLGWWSARGAAAAIAPDRWRACLIEDGDAPEPSEGEVVAFGVKFAPDGSGVALAACARPADGTPHVELVETRALSDGVGWLADFIAERRGTACSVAVDGMSGASALVERLAGRVPRRLVRRMSSADVIAACDTFSQAVAEGLVTHIAQDELERSVAGATRRPIGSNGGWGWGGDDPTPLEAVTDAYWAAMTSTRKPGRKLRIAY